MSRWPALPLTIGREVEVPPIGVSTARCRHVRALPLATGREVGVLPIGVSTVLPARPGAVTGDRP